MKNWSTCIINQGLKHPARWRWWYWWWWWWWWWLAMNSLSMIWITWRNSSRQQGIVIAPLCSNPYSSSASFNSPANKGWFKYSTLTINLSFSSPLLPTLTTMHPFGGDDDVVDDDDDFLVLEIIMWKPMRWWWWWWLRMAMDRRSRQFVG